VNEKLLSVFDVLVQQRREATVTCWPAPRPTASTRSTSRLQEPHEALPLCGTLTTADLDGADRSSCEGDFDLLEQGYGAGKSAVLFVQLARWGTFASAVAVAFGEQLVRDPLVVDVVPSAYSFDAKHVYVLDCLMHPPVCCKSL